ncbi:MAG: DUF2306 domain-containing protein [Myxococcota bacterium]
MRRLLVFLTPLALLTMALGSIAITAASVVYFDEDELAPFVIEKLPLPLEDVWLVALQVHVVSAAFALPACLLLLSKTLLRRTPGLHRWLGRMTGGVGLLALAPSGFYLSLFAKGGLLSTLGFMLSGVIVVVAMVQGVRTARQGQHAAHRRCSLHVLAQLSVAVTSRAMLFLFDAVNVDADTAYLISLWLPVVGSAGAVELLVSRTNPLTLSWRNHEAHSGTRLAPHHSPGLRDAAGV